MWWTRIFLAFLSLAFVVYAGDYLSIKYRIPRGRAQFGSVNVQRYYAVKLKNQRTELMFQPPESQACSNSLFPQLGASPCWYLERHATQKIDE